MKEQVLIRDPQTGEVWVRAEEKKIDAIAATWSGIYLLLMLALFFWMLFDIWIGRHYWARLLGYENTTALNTATFRIMAYTIIGGGLGGIVNGLRSLVFWHSERRAFAGRFAWKYVMLPFQGVALALFVYAAIRGGMTAFGADLSVQAAGAQPGFSALVIGALAGYGSREVFVWLDRRVKEIFKVPTEVTVPDLIGKTKKEAADTLKNAKLNMGNVTEQPSDKLEEIGRVIKQDPLPYTSMPSNGNVSLIVAVKKTVPDLIGKKQEEAEEILKAAKLIGELKPESAKKTEDIGKVIKQEPLPKAPIPSDSKVRFTVAFEKPVQGGSQIAPKPDTEGK